MKFKINGQEVSAKLVDGRYVYTFTPDKDMASVAVTSSCIGETELKRIQIEKSDKMTSFVVPEMIPPETSGAFKNINDMLLEMTDTENSSLWANIRLNARGMIESYHRDTISAEILKSAQGVATSFEDKLSKQSSSFETSLEGLRNTVRGHADSLTQLTQSVDGFEALAESVAGRSFRKQLPTIIEDRVFKDQLGTFIRQSGDNISLALQNKGDELISAINLSEGGIHLDGSTFTKDFTAEIAKIIEMDAGRITTGKLSGDFIEADSITGKQLKMDKAFFDTMASKTIKAEDGKVKNLFATTVQSVKVTAEQLSGAVLTALNNAMTVDLDRGQMLFYTDRAAIKRELPGYPTQFIKFETGTYDGRPSGVTVIGSNRSTGLYAESANNGGFVGIRAWNGPHADQLDLVGDNIRLASSPNIDADGWDIVTYPGQLKISPHRTVDYQSSEIHVGDIYLYHEGASRSLFEIIKMFNTSLRDLGGTYYTANALLN